MLLLAELSIVKLFEYKSLNPESHVSSDDDGGVEKPALNSLDVLLVESMSDIFVSFLLKLISGDVSVKPTDRQLQIGSDRMTMDFDDGV